VIYDTPDQIIASSVFKKDENKKKQKVISRLNFFREIKYCFFFCKRFLEKKKLLRLKAGVTIFMKVIDI
jgi:hypothetical protein